ncbi:MAG: phosphoenolpyruvate synthase [Acidobacteria bacterium]|nr:phosphoenolpyruvate synthase [Acidobacteriota bacterium]
MNKSYTLDFAEIGMKDLARVGGKNASLGQMYRALKPRGVGVLDGFATTVEAWWRFLEDNQLKLRLEQLFHDFDAENLEQLTSRGQAARSMILETPLPDELRSAITTAYRALLLRLGRESELAVRSSATAEDLPEASFAGAAETFLNVRGEEALLRAVHHCFASLFTDRAISYRARLGYGQSTIALSVGVMPMVRSDLASSGVIFTLDTETGFRNAVTVTGSYGLGEFIVQGVVTPDEWTVFKPTLANDKDAIIGRSVGSKEVQLVYAQGTRTTRSVATPPADRIRFCLTDEEVMQLARWACEIEAHYSERAQRPVPMDIEWAKDGISGALFIVQARPETVHAAKPETAMASVFRLKAKPAKALVSGQAVGMKIGSGVARVVSDVAALHEVKPGDVLVASSTNPDWEPVMKRVAAIITDHGGRTAHAAIVSREFGIPCIVGTGRATELIKTGDDITVCCAEGPVGRVYAGCLEYVEEVVDTRDLPPTRTKIMLTLGDPSQAFRFAALPNAGVGLARTEFIVTHHIGIHPMALVRFPHLKDGTAVEEIRKRLGGEDPLAFFVRRFSEGVGRIAAAFYPKPVIVRTSDFKTNEYAQLLGGREFEPEEENPMLGFRGASRYYHPGYAEGFALECQALARVRGEMGLNNVVVMIPFCRTVAEGAKVLAVMKEHGLEQGKEGLEVYAMCEIPSNVLLADDFLRIFDGYSIGSNDLTQLTLGLDRDSATVAPLFDENDAAVRMMIESAIRSAHRAGKPIGICGQAPSDFPEFAAWLAALRIHSISLNPDTAVQTAFTVAMAESRLAEDSATATVAQKA